MRALSILIGLMPLRHDYSMITLLSLCRDVGNADHQRHDDLKILKKIRTYLPEHHVLRKVALQVLVMGGELIEALA